MSEKVIVVDEDNNVIGSKPREDINWLKEGYRASTLWLANNSGEILIARKSLEHDKDPGKWGMAVSGTLREGEDYTTNMQKEIEEELGESDMDTIWVGVVPLSVPRLCFVGLYRAVTNKRIFNIQTSEVAEVDWIPKRALLDRVQKNPHEFVPSMGIMIDGILRSESN